MSDRTHHAPMAPRRSLPMLATAVACLAMAVAALLPSTAQAESGLGTLGSTPANGSSFIYWVNMGNGTSTTTIGRANLDGSGVNNSFIASACCNPGGLAVDGQHIYWSDLFFGTIGRANLDGSNVNWNFITLPDPEDNTARGVAVDGQHIYWADNSGIARANLDGSDLTEGFIPGILGAAGVAVDGQHVYWSDIFGGTIGRANLDGSDANHTFITGADSPAGVAVDGQHIYWMNASSDRNQTIGRANLDGSGVNENFISPPPNVNFRCSAATGFVTCAWGLAVDSQHIYWPIPTLGTIGVGTIARANLDGSGVNYFFINGANGPAGGIAVSSATETVGGPPPAPHFLKVSPSRTHRGKAITVSGSVGTGCRIGHRGDTAIVYSKAFKGAVRRSFARVPAVYVSLRSSKNGAFSFKLKLSKKLKTGSYMVVGRCGGGNFGSAKLTVVKP